MAKPPYKLSDIFNKETAIDVFLTPIFGIIAANNAMTFAQYPNIMSCVFGLLAGYLAAQQADSWKRKVTGTGFW